MQLLIIGSLDGQIGAASKIAIDAGARVTHAETIQQALVMLRDGRGGDLVMIDVNQQIAELVASLDGERIHVPVIACGVGTDSQAAVRAIKAGAKEYVPLPPDPHLIGAVLAAITQEDHALIYRDPAMAEVVRMATQVAKSDASVLIAADSGTGKELLARHIHMHSRRANKPFVAVNCAAIPETLLESELFGHEKGAFTGAVARRLGRFEDANGGTLLLDEISEMDVRLQAKLLRVLQEKEVDRIGGTKPVKVDVRIIATSNRNLRAAIAEGNFREDLLFRLNVVNLTLPPLRQRVKDIKVLAEHFLVKYADANDMDLLPLSDAALQRLEAHDWPGNVRELENTMHRAVLLGGPDEIGPQAILLEGGITDGVTAAPSGGQASPLVGRTVAEVERDLIIDTLRHCLGNRTHAANILGISIRTLRNKLKQYTAEGVSVPTPGEASV